VNVKARSVEQADLSSTTTVNVINPIPTISGVNVSRSDAFNYLLSITGTNFVGGTTVQIGASPAINPVSVSNTVISATISTAYLQQLQEQVVVVNPDPGSAESNVVEVSVPQQAASVTAAARLLDQATFGPTLTDISHVQQVGLDAYLQEQFNTPASLMPGESWWYNALDAGCKPFYTCQPDSYWIQYAMTAPDQLRQRVAFTLSKLWTVSYDSTPAPFFPYLLNIFASDAFLNWRQIMKDVTLSGAMGNYMNIANNMIQSSSDRPDENYGREFLQVFNLGPIRLNIDGTPQLDANGNTIPVYTQDQVVGFSKVFTGFTYANDNCSAPSAPQYITSTGVMFGLMCPMAALDAYHDHSEKQLLDGTVLPSGQSALVDLDAAIDNVFQDSNLPPFVAKFFIQNLVKSDPSPDYVKRIASVFIDDGHGTRGNMAAVIHSILLDPEARQDDVSGASSSDGGHLRDPLLWSLALLRSLNPVQSGDETAFRGIEYWMGWFGQAPHAAPSVFGYYSSNYVIPGSSVTGPEFQLETPGAVTTEMSTLEYYWLSNPIISASTTGASITLDLTSNGELGTLASQGIEPLIDGINILFYHGKMSNSVRSVFEKALQGLSPTQMVRVAVYLAATSPQFRVTQ